MGGEGFADGRVSEGFEFDEAGAFETGTGGGEFGTQEAWVDHEFSGACGKARDEFDEAFGSDVTGERKAGEVIGCAAVMALKYRVDPAAAQEREYLGDEAAFEGDAFVRGEIEGAAYPGNLVLLAEAGDRFEHRGKQEMGVLVGVEMKGDDFRVEDAIHLGAQFFVRLDLAAGESFD